MARITSKAMRARRIRPTNVRIDQGALPIGWLRRSFVVQPESVCIGTTVRRVQKGLRTHDRDAHAKSRRGFFWAILAMIAVLGAWHLAQRLDALAYNEVSHLA